MTAILLPNGKQQYFTTAGLPAVGYKVATFDAGTSNPRITWQDALKVAQQTNPIILDGRGEASIFWEGAYKVQLQDSTGAVIWTQDNLQSQPNGFAVSLVPGVTNSVDLGSSALSWRNLYLGPNNAPTLDTVTGNIGYYVRTAAEIAAGVTPVSYSYLPGVVDRYGTNTTPGTTDMRAAISAANSVWVNGGPGITFLANENYYCASAATITAPITFLPGAQLTPNPTGIVLTLNGAISGPPLKFFNQSLTTGGVAWANAPTTGALGYTAGGYSTVPITGGSGTGAVANITIFTSGGVNTFLVVMTSLGSGYHTSDTLSAATANLGGAGAGFSFTPFVTQVTGSMGGVDLIDRWFGVVADGNSSAGSGTNNQPFFQAAINCVVSRNGEANNAQVPNRILTLAGWYLVSSKVSVGDNVIWKGAGKFGSNIFAPSAFADSAGIIAINGGGTYPTTFSGFTVGGQVGGCSGNGIVVTKNATFLSDLWVSGLSNTAGSIGIVLSQTTVYLRDWVVELNSIGISITQIDVTVDSGETFQNQVVGININNSAALGGPGRVLLSNIRCQADVQGGVLCNDAQQVSMSNVHCVSSATNNFTGGAFQISKTSVGSNDIILTGCSARAATIGGTTGAGFNIQNSTNVTLNGCEGLLMQGGGLIANGATGLNLSGGSYSGNGNYGIRIIGGDLVTIGGFIAASNAFDGVNDNASIAGKHVIGPCMTANNGGWGLNLTAAATSFINSLGNTSEGNTSGAINKAGTIANINVVGNF